MTAFWRPVKGISRAASLQTKPGLEPWAVTTHILRRLAQERKPLKEGTHSLIVNLKGGTTHTFLSLCLEKLPPQPLPSAPLRKPRSERERVLRGQQELRLPAHCGACPSSPAAVDRAPEAHGFGGSVAASGQGKADTLHPQISQLPALGTLSTAMWLRCSFLLSKNYQQVGLGPEELEKERGVSLKGGNSFGFPEHLPCALWGHQITQ